MDTAPTIPSCPANYTCSFDPPNKFTGPWWQGTDGTIVAILVIVALGFVICFAAFWFFDLKKDKARRAEYKWEQESRAERDKYESDAGREHQVVMYKLKEGIIVETKSTCAECGEEINNTDYLCDGCREVDGEVDGEGGEIALSEQT